MIALAAAAYMSTDDRLEELSDALPLHSTIIPFHGPRESDSLVENGLLLHREVPGVVCRYLLTTILAPGLLVTAGGLPACLVIIGQCTSVQIPLCMHYS